MYIIAEAQIRKTDYTAIKQSCLFNMSYNKPVDISVIIPVRGRLQFNHPISDHLLAAIKLTQKRIAVTIVEHSQEPEHKNECYNWVNYIHIPTAGEFNKCLAFNIGALYSNPCKHYLFHDLDTIMLPDFFGRLYRNLADFDALQAFTKRRLIYCNDELSQQIINGHIPITGVNPHSPHVKIAESGAAGGSMFVSKELFFKVGGYDPDFFTGYSVEDQFFFDKLNLCGKLGFCDNPPIEMVHLWHSPSHRLTKDQDWDAIHSYKDLNNEEKLRFIEIESNHISKFII